MLLGTLSPYAIQPYTFYNATISRTWPMYSVTNVTVAFNLSANTLYAKSLDASWWNVKTNSLFTSVVSPSFSISKAEQAGRALWVVASDAAHLGHFQVFNLNARSTARSTMELIDTTPPSLLGIDTNVSALTATIRWSTSEVANTTVEYGTTLAYGSLVHNATFVTNHRFVLDNLTPLTLYHFRVRSTDVNGNVNTSIDMSFTTQSFDSSSCVDNDRDGVVEFNVTSCPIGTDLCYQPIVADWSGYEPHFDLSTHTGNITATDDFRNMSNFSLMFAGVARVVFRQPVRVVDVSPTGCFIPLNVTRLVKVRDKSVHIDTDLFSEFNRPATIIFENVSFIQPKVTKDAVDCVSPACTIQSYNSVTRVLTLDITGFSTYEVVEGYVPPTPPSTPTNTGGGGGGGGSTPPKKNNTINNTETPQTSTTPSQPASEEQPAQAPSQSIPQASSVTGGAITDTLNESRTGLFDLKSIFSLRTLGVVIGIVLLFAIELVISLRQKKIRREQLKMTSHTNS